MSSAGIRKFKTMQDRTVDLMVNQESNFIGALKVTGTEQSLGGIVSLGEATGGGPGAAVGNFLETGGGTMSGPIAYFPQEVTVDSDDNINIGFEQGAYSTYIRVTATGATDDLLNIIGAQFSGQDIILQGTDTKTITLKTTGNIVPPGGADFDLVDEAIIRGVFDDIQNKWVFYIGGGGGGEFFGPWTNNHDAGGFTLDNLLGLDIEDSAGDTRLTLTGLVGLGGRLTFNVSDSLFFTEGIDNRVEIDASGIKLLGHNLTLGAGGNILAGGAGFGMVTIGHLDFLDNLATPGANFSIYSDGQDLLANTGSRVTNLDDTALKSSNNTFTGTNIFSTQTTFTDNIVAGGAGDGVTNIGNLTFVDNLATPVATFAIFSDGTDLFANTGSATRNLDEMVTTGVANTFTAIQTFNLNIVAGGAGDGVTNIGHLDFIDNLATPVAAISLYSDGTDLFANTGGGVKNLSDIGVSFSDADFQIFDNITPAKILKFQLVGFNTGTSLISSGTLTGTRIWILPDITGELMSLDGTQTVLGNKTFNNNIVAGGAGDGMVTIGHLDFVDNLATPAASISLYSDGTDLFANTGGGVKNLSDIGGGSSNAISQLDSSLTVTDTGANGFWNWITDGVPRLTHTAITGFEFLDDIDMNAFKILFGSTTRFIDFDTTDGGIAIHQFAGDQFNLLWASALEYDFNETEFDLHNNNIILNSSSQIIWRVGTAPDQTRIEASGANMRFSVNNTSDEFLFRQWTGATYNDIVEFNQNEVRLLNIDLEMDSDEDIRWSASVGGVPRMYGLVTGDFHIEIPATSDFHFECGTNPDVQVEIFASTSNAFVVLKKQTNSLQSVFEAQQDRTAGGSSGKFGTFQGTAKDSANALQVYAGIEMFANVNTAGSAEGEIGIIPTCNGSFVDGITMRSPATGTIPEIGFRGATPQPVQFYTVSSFVTDRTMTGASALGEVADVLCTLIRDLENNGMLG